MISRMRIVTMGLLAISLFVPSSAFAQEDRPEQETFRAAGEITGVVPGQGTFTLHTRSGEELEFQTSDRTRYRSPDGSIENIHDLKKGMKALVVAIRQDEALQALLVAAGSPEDLPVHIRVAGEIQSVDLAGESFVLLPREGEALTFLTGERTRYRGEGIDDLGDLQPGMHGLVVGVKQEDGGVLALLVAVGEPKDRPEILKFAGEITAVVPGQGTFTIKSRDGEEVEFQTSERTKFRSKDGSVQDIHDLKHGMLAFVGAIEQEDGTLLALVVGARSAPDDRPLPENRPYREPEDRPNREPVPSPEPANEQVSA